MSLFRPSPDQERWLVVASHVRLQKQTPLLAERSGGWRTVSLVIRCAFFVLGIFAAGTAAGVFSLLRVPHFPLVAGVVLVAAAELLIVKRRVFASGIEEALEVVGLLLIAFDVQDSTGLSIETKAALLIAAAFGIAGLRLLNSLFTTLAIVAFSFAIEFAASGHSLQRSSGATTWTGLFCFAVGLLALASAALRFQRPSHDRMLDWLVLAMPLAGYHWAAADYILSATANWHDAAPVHWIATISLLVFSIAALVTGIHRRTHSPLLAFALCIACAAYELRNLTGLPLEARLILWGSVALAAAIALDRYLRTPRRGITSQEMSGREGPSNLLQLGGAAVLTPHTQPAQTSTFQGGGGSGAGGGASGTY